MYHIFHKKTKKSGTGQAPLSRETSYATRVAPQHCPALHMSKRRFMVALGITFVNRLWRIKNSHIWRFIFPPTAAHFPHEEWHEFLFRTSYT